MRILGTLFSMAVMVILIGAGSAQEKKAPDDDAKKLHGTWVGKSNTLESVTLAFGPKNVVKIQVAKNTGEGIYSVDWSKSPAHLDLDWGKKGKVTTIIELKEGNLVLENVEPGMDRPKMLTTKGITLKKDTVKR